MAEKEVAISNSRTAVSRNTWLNQALHNRLIAVVLAMVVFIPLIGVPTNIRVRNLGTVFFEIFAVLLLTMLLWNGQLDLRREKVVSFLKTGPNLPVLLLLGLSFVLFCFAPHKVYGMQSVIQLASCILLYFVVGYQFRQSKHLYMLLDVMMFLAVVLSIAVVVQYTVDPRSRGTALYGNQQLLGSMLMVLLPVITSVAMTDAPGYRRLVAQAATVMTAGALLLAQTRSAWLGALLGLLLVGVLQYRASRRKNAGAAVKRSLSSRKHVFVMPLLLAVVGLGAIGLIARQNSGIANRAGTLSDIRGVGSFQQRQQLWRGAIAMIKERPLLGFGPGVYPVRQYDYTGFGHAVVENGKRLAPTTLASQAHNHYLQTAAEIGLPGLALLLAVLIGYLTSAARLVPQMDEGIRRTMLIASMGSVAAFAVDSASSPSWEYVHIAMFLWLIMGIGLSCLRPRTQA